MLSRFLFYLIANSVFMCVSPPLKPIQHQKTNIIACPGKEETDDEDEKPEQFWPPTDSEEIKEDQWMGVTVRSQSVGGKVWIFF